jgi:Spy/CpxP family protein refolding chaperone
MKTNKWLSLALAAALNLGGWLTTPALAADTPAPAPGRFLQQLAQRLNLTADQKAQIKTILRAEKDTLKPLFSQLHAARENLRAAIQAGDANETTVRAASAQVAAVEADLAVERMKIYGKIAPVLTNEQRQQISDFRRRADDSTDRAIAHAAEGPAQ